MVPLFQQSCFSMFLGSGESERSQIISEGEVIKII